MKNQRTRGQRGPTRRSKGEGSIFQRSDGLWIGRIDLGHDDEGKKVRVQVSSKDKATVIKRLRDKRREIDDHGYAPRGATTVRTWLTYWIDNVAQVRPNTARTYRGIIDTHIIPAIGRHRLDRLEPRHVRDMLKVMERKQLTSARRQAYVILNKALGDAKAEGRLTRVVTDAIPAPNPRTAKRSGLSAGEARTLLRHVADDRLGSLWATYLLAGLRRGEAAGLTVDRVDLAADVLDISAQLQRLAWRHGCGERTDRGWPCGKNSPAACPGREIDAHVDYRYERLDGGLYLVAPKSDKGRRMVPIVPSLHAALESRLAALERERGKFTVDHGLVWPRPDGRPYDPKDITAAWDAACRAAGVTDVDLHSARHTTATLLHEAGVDGHTVEAIMGHSTVAVTRGYQHVDVTLARSGLLRMERLLELTE